MKLLRCHIVNYGCLHEFSYEFQSGINLINQPNGWGKSTFSSFLCAMLYGLDSTTKRNIQENERKHYHPWQEGPFGGSLEFDISGRQYRVERFFGLREREDTFILYDLKTMQPSQDYSSQLGIELFGIDKSGYLHSTFVPQGHSAPEYNNTLAARLNRLNQSASDINQYENAITELDKALRFYIKTGKRGEIAILQQEADATEQLLQEALSSNHQLAEANSALTNLKQLKKDLNQQLIAIQQQIKICTEQEVYAHYSLLKSQLNQKEHSLEEIEDFFHDQLPEDSDIELYLLSCTELSQLEQQEHQNALNSFQMTEYTFLQNFFSSSDILPTSLEKHLYNASVFDDEEIIFTREQQKLLIESDFYQTEAILLFPSDSASSSHGALSSTFDCTSPNNKDTDYSLLPEDLPDSETISHARELYYQYCTQLSDQKKASSLADTIKEQLHEITTSLEQENQKIIDCKKQLEQETAHQNYKHIFSPLILASLFLLAAGFLICYLWTPAIGLPIILFGSIIALYTHFSQKKAVGIPPDNELQIHNEIYIRLQKQISQLQAQLDSHQNQSAVSRSAAEDSRKQLIVISRQLHLPCEDSSLFTDTYLALLAQLDNQLQTYQQNHQRQYNLYKKQFAFYNQLKHKYEDYNLLLQKQKYCKQQITCLRQNIIQFLQPYFSIKESSTPSFLDMKLHELKSKLNTYRSLLSDMRLASQNLNLFFQEHPDFKRPDNERISAINSDKLISNEPYSNVNQSKENQFVKNHHAAENIAPSKSLEVLQSEESTLREQYADCIQQIGLLQSHIKQLQEKADTYCTLEEKHVKLKQQIEEYKEKYRILSLTKQYLTKARHDFTDSYLHSIEKNFNHYARLLEKSELLNANMNSDFHMIISDNGILRETGWYSQGTRDLINFCSRLAIVEDLFTDESPFLILDDPFVNLDNDSLQKLSFVLKNISKKWQILYFTCHSSRNIL